MAHPTVSGLHFEIDGEGFETLKKAYAVAKSRGFNGAFGCFHDRVMAGQRTWKELTAPVSDTLKKKAVSMHAGKAKKRQAEREEMAALMAEMDARKAALTH